MAWLGTWSKRIKITIDKDDIDGALTDFPVLVYISASSGRHSDDVSAVFDELGANRKRIAVTTSDGTTECYVEIEKWDDANEKAWLWVKVPAIASGVDTILYLYYDVLQADNNAFVGDTNSVPAENVWPDGYFITHFKDDPDNAHIRDSSSYSSDGTKVGANQPQTVAGDGTAYAQDFTPGNPDYIEIAADQTQLDFTSEDFSIILRLRPDSSLVSSRLFFRGLANVDGYYTSYAGDGKLSLITSQLGTYQSTISDYGALTADAWQTVGISRSGALAYLYFNGIDRTNIHAVHIDPTTSSRSVKIGIREDLTSQPFDGKIEFLGIFGGVALTAEFHKAFDQSITDDLLAFSSELPWIGKISGITNPTKIMGVDVANITKVKGVASA